MSLRPSRFEFGSFNMSFGKKNARNYIAPYSSRDPIYFILIYIYLIPFRHFWTSRANRICGVKFQSIWREKLRDGANVYLLFFLFFSFFFVPFLWILSWTEVATLTTSDGTILKCSIHIFLPFLSWTKVAATTSLEHF